MGTEISTSLIAAAAAIIITVLKPIVEKYFEKRKASSSDILREDIKINALVDKKLEEIKETYMTNKVWICQFHNGGYYYPTGKSMQKFSMTYELTHETSTFQHQFQNIPISLFSKAMDYLANGKTINIYDLNNDNTFGLDSFSDNSSFKSMHVFPLITIDNKFIGILGIGFLEKVKLSEEEINNLKLEVNSISNVLMNEYLTKK